MDDTEDHLFPHMVHLICCASLVPVIAGAAKRLHWIYLQLSRPVKLLYRHGEESQVLGSASPSSLTTVMKNTAARGRNENQLACQGAGRLTCPSGSFREHDQWNLLRRGR